MYNGGMKKPPFVSKVALLAVLPAILLVSCEKESQPSPYNGISDLQQISFVEKSHRWYYFTRDSFAQTDLPQKAPQVMEQPWTEAVRISSAASVPLKNAASSPFGAYAVVNRMGILAFSEDSIDIYTDATVFPSVTADQLVFSGGVPVFYLYRSSFFNESNEARVETQPFLVEFNPQTKIFFPLVTYRNLRLEDDEEIVGYFWDGETWTCSSKRITDRQVEFKYFLWQPLVELTELSPALSSDYYIFKNASEEEYRKLNMPQLFSAAPPELKSLVSSIPSEFTFYVSWRDASGTSPVNYYQQGTNSTSVNARGLCDSASGYDVIVFADGTTYLRNNRATDGEQSVFAFRLPLLPAGYTYGEVAIAGNSLYVGWEENIFYKTVRSGFIQIDIAQVISTI